MDSAIYLGLVIAFSAETLSPRLAISRADELYRAGNFHGAEQVLTQVLSRSELSRYHPHDVALAHGNLGAFYQDLSKPAEAERQYRKAQAILRPEKDTAAGGVLWHRIALNLASLYLESGQYGKAEHIVNGLKEQDLPGSDDSVRLRGAVASVYMARGNYAEAERVFLSVLDWWEKRSDPGQMAAVLNNLGVLAMERGDTAAAESRLSRGMQLWQAAAGANNPAVLRTMANYSALLLSTGRAIAARDLLERALQTAKAFHKHDTPVTAEIALLYSMALDKTGSRKEARRLRSEAQRASVALAAADPAAHTVNILDLTRRDVRKFR